MKRMLLITIVYPPEGGGGAIRPEKLAKFLPFFNWQSIIVTAAPPKGLLLEIPADDHVYRAPRCDIARALVLVMEMMKWILPTGRPDTVPKEIAAATPGDPVLVRPSRRLADFFCLPDDKIAWIPGAIVAGFWAIFRKKPEVIFSTSPSPSTLVAGYVLSKITRLPWIVEFRDPWTQNPFRQPRPFPFLETLEKSLEQWLLSTADHIIVTSEEYRQDFKKLNLSLDENKITYIPNGYDPDDFCGRTPHLFEIFTIIHAGNFYGARSCIPFLRAFALFMEEEPAAQGKVQLVLAGQQDARVDEEVGHLGLDGAVRQVGVVSHEKSIEMMLGADLLLLIPGPGRGTMPGKAYEYLAARKPVLAIADEGVTASLISSSGIGEVIGTTDHRLIAQTLASMYRQITTNSFTYPETSVYMEMFDRKAIAGRIAAILDQVSKRAGRS